MKRVLSLFLVMVLILSLFAGCSDDKGRVLYNVDLDDYIELGEYKGIKVDKTSDEFLKVRDSIISYDVELYGLYNHKTSGKVKDGDTVNIDYVGKKDGVAFEGGTASGYDLEIGSGTFIDGFESGLIGKKIGSTVDLNLKFPDNYGNAELAGAKVVFTVKINYVKSTDTKTPEEFYKSLGYSKVEEYYENLEERTVEEFLQQAVIEKSKILDYPQEDIDLMYPYYYQNYVYSIQNNYGITMEQFYSQTGQTESGFKTTLIASDIKPAMQQQMIWYAVLDKEEIEITKEDTEAKIKEIIAQNGDSSVDRADVIENLGEYYIEILVVSEKAFDVLKSNAKIK